MIISFLQKSIFIAFLLCCVVFRIEGGNLCSASAPVAHISISAPSIVLTQNAANKAALARKLLLPEKDKDSCLQEVTFHGRADCIQPVLETYYGKTFSISCPGFSLTLVQYGCRECPWDRINPEKLPEIGKFKLPLRPKKLFFKSVAKTCNIAKHVEQYGTRFPLGYVPMLGIIVSVLFSIISTLGAFATFGRENSTLVSVFGLGLPEYMYLGFLWLVFLCHSILASIMTITGIARLCFRILLCTRSSCSRTERHWEYRYPDACNYRNKKCRVGFFSFGATATREDTRGSKSAWLFSSFSCS